MTCTPATIEPDGYLGDSDPQVRRLLPDTSLPRCLDGARLEHLPTVFREGHLSRPSGKTIFFQPQGSAARRRTPSLATARQRVNIDLATRQRRLHPRLGPLGLPGRPAPIPTNVKHPPGHANLCQATAVSIALANVPGSGSRHNVCVSVQIKASLELQKRLYCKPF